MNDCALKITIEIDWKSMSEEICSLIQSFIWDEQIKKCSFNFHDFEISHDKSESITIDLCEQNPISGIEIEKLGFWSGSQFRDNHLNL